MSCSYGPIGDALWYRPILAQARKQRNQNEEA